MIRPEEAWRQRQVRSSACASTCFSERDRPILQQDDVVAFAATAAAVEVVGELCNLEKVL